MHSYQDILIDAIRSSDEVSRAVFRTSRNLEQLRKKHVQSDKSTDDIRVVVTRLSGMVAQLWAVGDQVRGFHDELQEMYDSSDTG